MKGQFGGYFTLLLWFRPSDSIEHEYSIILCITVAHDLHANDYVTQDRCIKPALNGQMQV